MLKILIVDDHYVFRNSIRQLLLEEKDFYIMGEASNSEVLSNQTYTLGFDILIIDISSYGIYGHDILSSLKKTNPEMKILALGLNNDKEIAQRIIGNGADGYITKDTVMTELVPALKQISNHMKFIGSSVSG